MNGSQTTLPAAEEHTCQAHSILINVSNSQCISQAGNTQSVCCTCMACQASAGALQQLTDWAHIP